jgi:hypothetical protein
VGRPERRVAPTAVLTPGAELGRVAVSEAEGLGDRPSDHRISSDRPSRSAAKRSTIAGCVPVGWLAGALPPSAYAPGCSGRQSAHVPLGFSLRWVATCAVTAERAPWTSNGSAGDSAWISMTGTESHDSAPQREAGLATRRPVRLAKRPFYAVRATERHEHAWGRGRRRHGRLPRWSQRELNPCLDRERVASYRLDDGTGGPNHVPQKACPSGFSWPFGHSTIAQQGSERRCATPLL